MIEANLHARNQELKVAVTHIEYTDPFWIITMRTKTSGEFRIFVDYHQLQQIAATINDYVTANPNETNNAYAS